MKARTINTSGPPRTGVLNQVQVVHVRAVRAVAVILGQAIAQMSLAELCKNVTNGEQKSKCSHEIWVSRDLLRAGGLLAVIVAKLT